MPGDGWCIFEAWLKKCQTPDRHIPKPTRPPEEEWASVVAAGTAPTLTLPELMQKLQTTAQLHGKPIRWWPEPETKLEPTKPAKGSKLNVAAALKHMGVTLYKDDFALRRRVEGLKRHKEIGDDAVRSLWFRAKALGLRDKKDFFVEAVLDIADADRRHPLQDYLAKVEADYRARVERLGEPKPGQALIENWLIKYAGADDTPLNRAFSRKWSLAAVRRARTPGTKFDQMLVLESRQGMGKSTLAKTLATPDWFEENLKLGADAQDVIQQTSGKWIVEIAELAGLSNKETEVVKQMLSRGSDRAALKYEKFATDAPRQFVLIGTTNNDQYLRDPTGNRRYWPIKVRKEISERRIKAIRDHLWGEAAYYERKGESVELPRDLWGAAAVVQAESEINDPLEEKIGPALDGLHGFIKLPALWRLAGYTDDNPEVQSQAMRTRLGLIMGKLGWKYRRKWEGGNWAVRYEKPNEDGAINIELTVSALGVVDTKHHSGPVGAPPPPKVVNFTSARATARV